MKTLILLALILTACGSSTGIDGGNYIGVFIGYPDSEMSCAMPKTGAEDYCSMRFKRSAYDTVRIFINQNYGYGGVVPLQFQTEQALKNPKVKFYDVNHCLTWEQSGKDTISLNGQPYVNTVAIEPCTPFVYENEL